MYYIQPCIVNMLSSHSQDYERLRKIPLFVLSPFLMKNFIRKKKSYIPLLKYMFMPGAK